MGRSRVWAFPGSWRARYGDELARLLSDIEHERGQLSLGDRFDLARAGCAVRVFGWWTSFQQASRRMVATLGTAVVAGCVGAAALVGGAFTPTYFSGFPARTLPTTALSPRAQVPRRNF